MKFFKALILVGLLFAFWASNTLINNGGETVIKNKAAIAQVNGGDAEYIANRMVNNSSVAVTAIICVSETVVFLMLFWAFFRKDLKRTIRPDMYDQDGKRRNG